MFEDEDNFLEEINSPKSLKDRFDKLTKLNLVGDELSDKVINSKNLSIRREKPSNEKISYAMNYCLAIFNDTANYLGVKPITLKNWMAKDPELQQAWTEAQEIAKDYVESKILSRIKGYTYYEEKAFCYKGEIIKTEVKRFSPPDVTACVEYLKAHAKERGYGNNKGVEEKLQSFVDHLLLMDAERDQYKVKELQDKLVTDLLEDD